MTQEEKKPEKRTRRQYSVEERTKLLDAADAPGESISTIARKHGVSPSVMFRWRQLRESGGMTSLKPDEELVPASEMRAARTKIRELQRLLGKKTEEVEILKEGGVRARKKTVIAVAVASTGRRRMTTVARVFGVARSNLVLRVHPPPPVHPI
jgi:transposase